MKQRLCVLAALGCSLFGVQALAQTRLDRYVAPALPDDGLRLSRPVALEQRQLSALLAFDYADDPLVLELERGIRDTETARLVDDQLVAHARFAYGLFDRLVVTAGVDFAMMMAGDEFDDPVSGTTLAPADGAGVGDARLGIRYVPLGSAESFGSLAIDLESSVPLARGANSGQSLSGERGVTVHPAILAELRPGDLRFTTNFGVLVREDSRVLGTAITDELTFGAGAGARLPGRLRPLEVIAEVYGATDAADAFARGRTPVEALFGGRWSMNESWRFTLAGGPGVQRGIGSPDMRALASIGFVQAPDIDGDGDSILDDLDACISDAEDQDGFQDHDGCPDLDDDGDGVPDAADRCAAEAEDRDGFQDEDGCADPDDDGDGIPDGADACTSDAEDIDGDRDTDGCPDHEALDADGDGLSDQDDRCPAEAEDTDQFDDGDGCPDPDNDGDGVPDARDACPLVAGTADAQGCAVVHLDESQIRIDERVEFDKGEATLLPASAPLMEQIRALLEKNPQVKLIAVEGHTDATGAAAFNQQLSEERAVSVARWLIEHGIAPERLTAWGCGSQRPLEGASTLAALQKNRRVELHLIDPAPRELHSAEGCRQVPIGPR